jgi:hypothetical protein
MTNTTAHNPRIPPRITAEDGRFHEKLRLLLLVKEVGVLEEDGEKNVLTLEGGTEWGMEKIE